MAGVKTYSLRPPAVAKDATLETLFRVEMKKDDMAAEGVKAGDAVVIQTNGKGGVGIASLSSETAKSQGSNSFVKIDPKLREHLGLELSDKCSITKFNDAFSKLRKVSVTVDAETKSFSDGLTIENLSAWARIALAQLPAVVAGYNFSVTPSSGPVKHKKRILTIQSIESESAAPPDLKVPGWFDIESSEINIDGAGSVTSKSAPNPTSDTAMAIQPSFLGLPGIDMELEQLSQCVQRINRKLDDNLRVLQACSPILLHGSTGTGKSAVLKQLAAAAGWQKVVNIEGSQLSASNSKARTAIANAFSEASATQPSLVILDDLDTVAGRQSDSPVVAKTLIEHVQKAEGSRVQFIAAARRTIDVDQSLLPYFDDKIELPTPSPAARRKILSHFTAGLADEETLDFIAEKTHAFIAQDLRALCRKAYDVSEQILKRSTEVKQNGVLNGVEPSAQRPISISKANFIEALTHVHPSLMNELYVEIPKVYWSDIAGSQDVKRKLFEAVELPLKRPDIVAALNLHPNHGILLYGPPGCSKTMTAKALATESGVNFIAVKGPELVSKYVGESEYKIREVFRKARAAAPSVIFFDEIDSIAPDRGAGGGHEGLNTVATLLNEMDGVEDVQKVLVLAATNRPDAIDPALLRPGRLGTAILVNRPNLEAISQILQMRTSKMSPYSDVDLSIVAESIVKSEKRLFSGADVAELCEAAGLLCATEIMEKGGEVSLQQRHLMRALEGARPSLAREEVEFFEKWSTSRKG